MAYPNCLAYDPAFAYEMAVIIEDGIRRMYVEQESVFYYLTVMNEQYAMPPMPEGARDGILKGLYRFQRDIEAERRTPRAAVRQRRHPARSHQGAGDPRVEVRRRRRRVERDELRRAVSRRPRVRALEHAASAASPARAVRHRVPEGRARRPGGGVRLREGAAGFDRPLAAAAAARARHRRLRTQREPRLPARFLRSGLPLRRRGDAGARSRARARWTRRSFSRRSRRTTSTQRRAIPQIRNDG